MSRARWSADDIGYTGPATIPVQPAHAATEVGAEDKPRRLRRRTPYSDGLRAARGLVLAVAVSLAAAALVMAVARVVAGWGGA